MSETFIITILLFIYIVIREVITHRQMTTLQKLIKSENLQEFNDYTNQQKATPRRYWGRSHGENELMEQPNEISVDDPEFDLSKVTQINIDGEEKPISIL